MTDRANELCLQFTQWLANVSELETQTEIFEVLGVVEETCKHLGQVVYINSNSIWKQK